MTDRPTDGRTNGRGKVYIVNSMVHMYTYTYLHMCLYKVNFLPVHHTPAMLDMKTLVSADEGIAYVKEDVIRRLMF